MQAIRGRDVSEKRPFLAWLQVIRARNRLQAGSYPQSRLPDPHSALRLPQWAAAAAAFIALVGAASLRADEPYRKLRDAALEYHGPASDFANLTELRLGWFGPSDPADPLTGDAWFAATLAIDEANAASGTGLPTRGIAPPPGGTGLPTRDSTPPSLPFRLVPRWAPDPWRAGVSQLTRMVYDEQPLALLGSVDSASTHLAEQIVAKAQLPLVSPFTTDKSITLAGVAWMFTCAPSDAAIASTLVDAVLDAVPPPASGTGLQTRDLPAIPPPGGAGFTPAIPPSTLVAGPRSDSASAVAEPRSGSAPLPAPAPQSETQNPKLETRNHLLLLSGTDHESRLTAREVMREFSLRKRLPDSRFELTPGLALPPQVLATLEQSAPTIIVLIANPEDSARWLTTLREHLAARAPASADAPVFFGSHTMGRTRFLQLAGLAAEGVQYPLLWNPDSASPEAIAFTARFRAARGHAPDYTAVYTYDATRLLVAAIHRAGPNRARIRDSILALSPWSGLAGPVHFDGTGQNTRSALAMGTIRNGAIVPIPSAPPSAQPRLSP